jgi:antitoxin ParD1/3/4
MTVTLTDELEDLISEKIKSGAYQSADEVIMASLRLLEAQERGTEALRHEIMRGVEDIQQGRLSALETDADLEAFSEKIIGQGRHQSNGSESM